MNVCFWNTRGELPLFLGSYQIEFRGIVSATIPLPEPDKMADLVLVNEMHHFFDNGRQDIYRPQQKFASIKKVVVDRKHGPPKLRYYFR
jgi:hypothetical protein